MALTSTTIQPGVNIEKPTSFVYDNGTSLLAAILLTLFVTQKSSKQVRKLKRQAAWTLLKLKWKSFFAKPFSIKALSDRELLYILIGALALVILIIDVVAGLVVILIGILLYLFLNRKA